MPADEMDHDQDVEPGGRGTLSGTTRPVSSTAHWLAVAATVFTWPLLFVGGLVTSYRVGMAVPDWPTTFGINMFLYDMSQAAWGVFIEHGHRLYGSAVGLACVLLAAWFTVTERRRRPWLMSLAWVALLAVIAQGVLGGIRVRWVSTELAAVHGCTGLAFFGLMTALCVFTGRMWSLPTERFPDAAKLRRLTVVNLAIIYAQIVIGALLRHFEIGLWVHGILAVGVLGHIAMLAKRAFSQSTIAPELKASAASMVVFGAIQFVLGVCAWWVLRPFDGIPNEVTSGQALIRTAHQANAALVLASAVVLMLRSYRRFGAPAAARATKIPQESRILAEVGA